jgi:hypothetical protein
LLISLPPNEADLILDELPEAYTIGEVRALDTKPLEVLA